MANKKPPKPIAGKLQQNIQQPADAKVSLNLKLAILLGVFALVVYANTLNHGYVLDDLSAITSNTIVKKGIAGIPELFSTPYRRGFNILANDLYRPLSLVTFATEFQLFGLNPMPGHLINILLFAGCVMLLFLFLAGLFEGKRNNAAFIASLLFALHPIHTEVVANIKSRDELLCFFFAFLSLNIFLKYLEKGKITQLLLGSVCFLFSLLSKETSIAFLGIIPLVFFFYRNENKRHSTYITAGTAVAALTFLVARYSVLNAHHANNLADIPFLDNFLSGKDLSVSSRIATAVLILGYYIRLLFIPYPLSCDYSYNSIPAVTFSDPFTLLSLAIYASIICFGIRLFLKNRKDPFAFAILFFLATIFLFSNIPFLIGSAMAERFLFFSSAGFCLAIALLIELCAKKTTAAPLVKQPRVIWILIPLCAVYSLLTIARNADWADNYTLFSADVEKHPKDARLNYYLGSELGEKAAPQERNPEKQKKIYSESIAYLNKSLAIYPLFDKAEANLGYTYRILSQFDSAALHDQRAMQLNPKNTLAINNLAEIYVIKKRFAEAIALYQKAIELKPDVPAPYTNSGICYFSLGKYDSAVYVLNNAIPIDPDFSRSYEILAITYNTMAKPDSAKKYEAIARQSNPGFSMQ